MTDNAQKTPTAQYIAQAISKIANRVVSQLGLSLPGQVVSVVGSVITAKFNVTSSQNIPNRKMPMFGPEYIRYPTQPGDLGVAVSVSASLGPASGLGNGMPNLNQAQGNLANLFWMPISSANWSPTDDLNSVVIYGPNGVVLRTQDGTCKISISKTGIAIIPPAGLQVIVNGNLQIDGNLQLTGLIQGVGAVPYAGNIHTTGTVTGDTDVIAGTTSGRHHRHGGVTSGSADTSPPV
jgi:hypothetical protein